MNAVELASAVGAGLGAGAPVAAVVLRNLGALARKVERAVVALERIASRLEGADYVKLAPSAVDSRPDAA